MYSIVSGVLLIFSFLQTFFKKYIPLFPFIILLILVSGFRYEVGKDYIVYENMFMSINDITDNPLIEPGFKYIILTLKYINCDSFCIFFFLATISILLYYASIIKQTNNTYLALFIFFNTELIVTVFSGIRQGIAMAIFVYLLDDLYKRNFIKVLIGSIIAISIHITGILILVAYFVPRQITIKKKYIIALLVISIIFIYLDISKFIIELSPNYIQYKFLTYAEAFDEKINILRILQRILLILPFLIYYNQIVNINSRLKYFIYIYLLGFFFYIIFSHNLAFATRINQFYRILEILMYPMLFEIIQSKKIKLLLFLLVALWSSSILFALLKIPENYPYRFWNIF